MFVNMKKDFIKKMIVSDMIKKSVKVKKLTLILISLTLLSLIGCGGTGTNNDQGSAFLAFSYFQAGSVTEPVSFGSTSLFDGANPLLIGLGLQNRLVGEGNTVTVPTGGAAATITSDDGDGTGAGQFLRVTQINCSYNVPGGNIGEFRDSTNVGNVINAGSTVSVTFPIISSGVKSFLSTRVNQLPSFPFNLVASCYGVGVSQAGDVFESNELPMQILITDDIVSAAAPAVINEATVATIADATVTSATVADEETEINNDSAAIDSTSAL